MQKDKLDIEFSEIDPDNFHLFVRIKIGPKKARLLLDTGASKTVFDQTRILKFIKSNTLKDVEGNSVGLGSNHVETQITKIKSLSFGKIKLSNVEVASMNLNNVLETYTMLKMEAIDGVLGSDLLYRLKAVIDYEKKVLKVKGK